MLISPAYAQAAGAADPTGGIMGLLPIVLMFVVLWFLMIRPQMKRAKEHKSMVEALAKGDEVVTQGGVAGRAAECAQCDCRGAQVEHEHDAGGTWLAHRLDAAHER